MSHFRVRRTHPSDPWATRQGKGVRSPEHVVSLAHGSCSTHDPEGIIPIYEYSCQDCGSEFEALIRGGNEPKCPDCESSSLERIFSLPTVHSSSTHEMAMRAAKKRDKKQGEERMHTQREYELNHDDH